MFYLSCVFSKKRVDLILPLWGKCRFAFLGKLPLGKLHIWKVETWEVAQALGKCLWEST